MRLERRAPASPAFRDLFRMVRELACDKNPLSGDTSIEWHEAHPLWNLQYMQTSTGLNSVATGVRPEGGEPYEWWSSTEDLVNNVVQRTISIGHLSLIDVEHEFDEMGKGGCENELTIDGQVIQCGDAFYEPDWNGTFDQYSMARILEDRDIRRLIAHVEGWQ